MPVQVPQQASQGLFDAMSGLDIYREIEKHVEQVVDTPSFADQIKKRSEEAFKSVFSSLHAMMVRLTIFEIMTLTRVIDFTTKISDLLCW